MVRYFDDHGDERLNYDALAELLVAMDRPAVEKKATTGGAAELQSVAKAAAAGEGSRDPSRKTVRRSTSRAVLDVAQKLRELILKDIQEHSIEETFAEFDTNRSGRVTVSEFRAILQRLGLSQHLRGRDESALVDLFDEDGDGHVDYSEFIAFVYDGVGDGSADSAAAGEDTVVVTMRRLRAALAADAALAQTLQRSLDEAGVRGMTRSSNFVRVVSGMRSLGVSAKVGAAGAAAAREHG